MGLPGAVLDMAKDLAMTKAKAATARVFVQKRQMETLKRLQARLA